MGKHLGRYFPFPPALASVKSWGSGTEQQAAVPCPAQPQRRPWLQPSGVSALPRLRGLSEHQMGSRHFPKGQERRTAALALHSTLPDVFVNLLAVR